MNKTKNENKTNNGKNKRKVLVIGRKMSKKTTLADRCNAFCKLDEEFFSDIDSYFYHRIVEEQNNDINFSMTKFEMSHEKYKLYKIKMRNNKKYAKRKIIEFCSNNDYYYLADYDDFNESGYLTNKDILKDVEYDCFVYYCDTITKAVKMFQN